jgi:hypothetical protein
LAGQSNGSLGLPTVFLPGLAGLISSFFPTESENIIEGGVRAEHA